MPGLIRLRIITVLLATGILFAFYSRILFHPGSYAFDKGGDGIKSYFCILYHIHDKNAPAFHFRGMNYPFGENLNFLDAQPIFTLAVKKLQPYFALSDTGIIALLHLLTFLCIPLSILLIANIFFEYGVRNWLAVAFALSIGFISPQLHRIYTHISLSYTLIIPLAWLLFLYGRKAKGSRLYMYYSAIVLLCIIAGMLHFYYSGILAILLLILIAEMRADYRKKLIAIAILIVLPLIIIRLIMKQAGDTVTDRAVLPYGAFGQAFRSRPEDVFFPNPSSFWYRIINFHGIARGSWEGEAFIGFALWIPVLLFIVLCFMRKKAANSRAFGRKALFLYAVVVIFIFTTGTFHFILPRSVKLAAPDFIRNFRSAGRLAWLIFFALSFYFYIFFARWIRLQQIKKRSAYLYPLIAVLLLSAIDIFENNSRVLANTAMEANRMDWENHACKKQAENINPGNYQALMMLPYYHIGADIPAERAAIDKQLYDGYMFSLASGLPLTNMNATRNSIGQAEMQTGLFAAGAHPICKYYPSRKPFLLYISAECRDSIIQSRSTFTKKYYPREKELFDKSVLLDKNGSTGLYRLDFNDVCR